MSRTTFEEKLIKLQSKMLTYARALTKNHDDAKDLLQDTTLRALDCRSKYRENTNFNGWVYTIMRNVFINNYRRKVREATQIDKTENQFLVDKGVDISTMETPEQSYGVKEINAAIEALSDDYRTPLNMHILGYKYDEIADRLGLPLGTVKSRIFFARKKVQAIFADCR